MGVEKDNRTVELHYRENGVKRVIKAPFWLIGTILRVLGNVTHVSMHVDPNPSDPYKRPKHPTDIEYKH